MCISCMICRMDDMTQEYLKNLADLILLKMENGNYTAARFADECRISLRELNRIKNKEANNIRLSTLVRICTTHGISFSDIFEYQTCLNTQAAQATRAEFYFLT